MLATLRQRRSGLNETATTVKKVGRIKHEPVLLDEIVRALNIEKGGKYIDATVGLGGHAEAVCKAGGRVLGLEWDEKALKEARRRLNKACPDAVLVRTNFAKLAEVAQETGFVPADGVFFDLGVSTLQLEAEGRGFSFLRDEPLDMRMDPQHQGVRAQDLLNSLPERQLYELFSQTTEKKLARAVARAVFSQRRIKPVESTTQLADLVSRVYRGRRRKIHPATTVFLALRMAVNFELENLKVSLPQAVDVLTEGGRLAVISFHSGEDRLVKNFLREKGKRGQVRVLTKKPITPGEEEKEKNPRSRSAKLRVGEKL